MKWRMVGRSQVAASSTRASGWVSATGNEAVPDHEGEVVVGGVLGVRDEGFGEGARSSTGRRWRVEARVRRTEADGQSRRGG